MNRTPLSAVRASILVVQFWKKPCIVTDEWNRRCRSSESLAGHETHETTGAGADELAGARPPNFWQLGDREHDTSLLGAPLKNFRRFAPEISVTPT